jgi:hypothetical protein
MNELVINDRGPQSGLDGPRDDPAVVPLSVHLKQIAAVGAMLAEQAGERQNGNRHRFDVSL